MSKVILILIFFIASSFAAERHTYWVCQVLIDTETTTTIVRWHIAEVVEAKTEEKAKRKFNDFLNKDPNYGKGRIVEGSYWVGPFNPYKHIIK